MTSLTWNLASIFKALFSALRILAKWHCQAKCDNQGVSEDELTQVKSEEPPSKRNLHLLLLLRTSLQTSMDNNVLLFHWRTFTREKLSRIQESENVNGRGGHRGFSPGQFFFVSTLLIAGRYGRYICVKEIGGLGPGERITQSWFV